MTLIYILWKEGTMKPIFKACVLASSILLTTLCISAQTGQPYYNVTAAPYNATCNGNPTSDDTGAIQHALNDARTAGGGTVLIPITSGACIIQSALNLDHSTGISLIGISAMGSRPTVLFTGTSGPLLSLRSANQVSIKNLNLQYSAPSFSGTFIDLSPASAGTFSDLVYIADSTIQGTANFSTVPPVGTATGANPLVYMDQAINVTMERNLFEWAMNGIIGQANSNGYSNVVRIRDNLFSGYGTNSISGNMILNLGQAWTIEGNTFEMGGPSTGAPIAINGNTQGCNGCVISGNWIGDTQPQFNTGLIQGQYQGTSFTGNFIYGGSSSAGYGIILGPLSFGVSITGNSFLVQGVAVGLQAQIPNLFVEANSYQQVNSVLTGQPLHGLVEDISGNHAFYGNVNVHGTLAKTSGSFKIDHPLDPANKYLSHSFVESPDMMNIYNGVVTVDSHGRAEVKLPGYFEALNRDFRYQLTSVGAFAPVYVAQKIRGNSFRIAGGKPGMEVSWQVTGIRHDAYANEHRIVVEEEKSVQEKKTLGSSSGKATNTNASHNQQ
jgi:hypothetical protein